MKVIVGAPVYNRLYVIPQWLKTIRQQNFNGEIDVIALDSNSTDGTTQFLQSHEVKVFQYGDGKNETWDRREQVFDIHLMTDKRNKLTEKICELKPDFYFAVDCDLMFPVDCVERLIENMIQNDINIITPLLYNITPECSLTYIEKKNYPNIMSLKESGRAYRREDYPINALFPVDIVMGAVLQSPPVYQQVRHSFNTQGDSVGWGLNAKAKGFQPYCDSKIEVVHFRKKL